jgi:hypothetical protein
VSALQRRVRSEVSVAPLLLAALRIPQRGIARAAARATEGAATLVRPAAIDVQSMSFLAVGRKYGVSDNAVRKWLRYYEREV